MSISSSHPMPARRPAAPAPDGLADVLERVLDKGLVIAGDIQINLLDIELLTIKVRLLLASVETAQEMGIDWWRHDRFLSGEAAEEDPEGRVAALQRRVDELEALVAGQTDGSRPAALEEDQQLEEDQRPAEVDGT